MLKIQLISVPPKISGKFAEFGEKIGPPMGILYIASYLKSKLSNLEVSVVDGLLLGYNKTLERIKDFKPDIPGLSFNTPVANSAYEMSRDVRKIIPGVVIMLGGSHATSLPEESLRQSSADVVISGEGEEGVMELIELFRKNPSFDKKSLYSVKGVAFLDEEVFCQTESRPYIKDLDLLPIPDRRLVDMPQYRGWYLCKKTPETIMIFSRGCPFSCTFCSNKVWNISNPRVRLRSPANIVDEIELLRDKFGIREVFDNSDEFNNNLSHAKEICREMIRRNTGITWKTQLRAYPLDEELVSLMSKSGCWYVHLGIESGNENVLKGIKKNITLKQVEEACQLLKKYKIKILGLFMLFNVWEEGGELKYKDVNSSLNTLKFARKLVNNGLIDYLGWSITTPYPGSPLYEIALKNRLFKPGIKDNWDAWIKDDFFVMDLPGITDRAFCLMRSGGFSFKDLTYIFKKALKILENELKSRLK